jgi:hypothetical protein
VIEYPTLTEFGPLGNGINRQTGDSIIENHLLRSIQDEVLRKNFHVSNTKPSSQYSKDFQLKRTRKINDLCA